jgi:hypothetical protein
MKHRDQVLALLQKQIGNANEVKEIQDTAEEVVGKWVNPLTGGKEETNGLIYGFVQSGKTGVLTVTGAMGADEGYRTIIDRDRGTPHDAAPPPPPGIRVRTTAVRPG